MFIKSPVHDKRMTGSVIKRTLTMPRVTLYGIKNCDTVKKARTWLDANKVKYEFHDFRSDGIDQSRINDWIKKLDANTLVNKKSTTWRNLSEDERAMADSVSSLLALLVENPTLIKRPVMEKADTVVVGFKADNYQLIFSNQ